MHGQRWIRALLRLYPASFRERFGDTVEETWVDASREAFERGRGPGVAHVIAATGSLLWGAAVAHFAPPGGRRIGARTVLHDLRLAARALARRPGYAGAAILTLALGIGANTAIFSVVHGVLLRPLDFVDPEGLVAVGTRFDDDPTRLGFMSPPDTEDLAESDGIEELVGYTAGQRALTGLGDAVMIRVARSTSGLMSVFREVPALGRDLRAEDDDPEEPRVAVVSDGFWRSRLGARPDVVGTTIELGGERWEVVGVAPRSFDFPEDVEVWVPMRLDPEGCPRGCQALRVIGRLAPGADLERVRSAVGAIATRLEQDYPETNDGREFRVVRLLDAVVADVSRALWFLLGAVALVLLIACANVANLVLARSRARRSEVAVRAAMGASRARLLSQVLAESALLAVGGGLGGLVLALGGVRLLRLLAPTDLPRLDLVAIDGTVLLFTMGLVGVVTVLFGLGPALRLSRTSPAAELGSGRSGSMGTRRAGRRMLVTLELALSVVLLIGAGLFLRTFAELTAVETGFETRDITRFRVTLPASRYPELADVTGFFEGLEQSLSGLPGVESVGSIFGPPLVTRQVWGFVETDETAVDPTREGHTAVLRPVTPGFLATLRIPVVQGRAFRLSDLDGPGVAIVNERFARENFGGDALGERFRIGISMGFEAPDVTVVGVVPDLRTLSLTDEPVSEAYVPLHHAGARSLTVHVRAAPGTTGLVRAIRETVAGLDPALPVYEVGTVEASWRRLVAPARFYAVLIGVFAALAVVLASVGLYGVIAYLVALRTQEIGLRVALGAEPGEIVRFMLHEGAVPAALGIGLGMTLALAFATGAEALLFGVGPRDPLVFLGAPLLLGGIALTATAIPARKASRIDPVEALRSD